MRPVVYLVDDNEAFRRSTAWLLEAADFSVRDYPGAREFLVALDRANGNAAGEACIVSDIRMPGMSGVELHDELRKRECTLPIVFITAHGDVPLAVEAMRKGASDFLEKPFSEERLVHAIRGALEQHQEAPARSPDADRKLATLTPRERQVMELVVAGKLNKLVADELGISIKTVELHRANMMNKLGVRNLPDLVRLTMGQP
ncbi:response regulator transcription factor [Dokdonella sp. MW10]|uniref:response regulator transcription factor n=1 Tax=Dokdonella sp. MW10 TaxID=2992926 RepID=UPI003F7CEC47